MSSRNPAFTLPLLGRIFSFCYRIKSLPDLTTGLQCFFSGSGKTNFWINTNGKKLFFPAMAVFQPPVFRAVGLNVQIKPPTIMQLI